MSTSDKAPQAGWTRWQPDNLLADVAMSPEPLLRGPSEEQVQVELKQLRLRMEQKGFAEGQAKGLEEGNRQGYQQGFLQGQEEGRAQALAEAAQEQKQKMAGIEQLMTTFRGELTSLQRAIPSRLVQLSLTATRAVIGHNLVDDHPALLAKIQHLMQQESLFKGPLLLWVGQQDAAYVQEQLGETLAKQGWELHIDPQILTGGCRITSEEGEMDATLSSRWEALCQLGRAGDSV